MLNPIRKTIPNAIVLSALAIPFLWLGCIKRTEVIAILPDGSVSMVTHIEADPADADAGDALPTVESGWQVKDRIETDNEGKETFYRTARLRVSARQDLPSSYAVAGSDLEPYALWFPTEVTVEQRSDGVYYHFRRVYRGRTFARIEYWRKRFMESDAIKKITEQPPEAITDADRKALAAALVAFDGAKAVDFFDQAAESVMADVPQDAVLAARLALRNVYDDEELHARVESLLAQDDTGPELDELGTKLRDRAATSVRDALEQKSVARVTIDAVLAACADARRSFEITEDLGDEDWTVKVVMPGQIIGHNSYQQPEPRQVNLVELVDEAEPEFAPLVSELSVVGFEHGFSEIGWTFDGKALYDRNVVLMATSFVPRD